MLWAEFGCRWIPYESFHVTPSTLLPPLCQLLSEFEAGAEGSLAEALQGRGRNTLKTAQKGTREEISLPPTGQSKQKLRNQLTAQTRKGLEEPCGLSSAAARGGEGGQRGNKVSVRIPLHPPYSNKSLFREQQISLPLWIKGRLKATFVNRLLSPWVIPDAHQLTTCRKAILRKPLVKKEKFISK